MDTEDGVEEGRPQVGDRDPAAVPLGVLDTNNSGEFRGDAQSNGFGKRDLCSTIARPYKPNDCQSVSAWFRKNRVVLAGTV